jgi:hypothetical protein
MMTVLKIAFDAAVALSLLLAATPAQATAQVPRGEVSPESLVALLRSPDWKVRDRAVAGLNFLPLSNLPASYAPSIITLFEREAISPDPSTEADG